MTVLNYTTKIAANKTIAEIQNMLAKHGAARVALDYAGGKPSGLTFALETPHGTKLFTLPVDVDAMERLLVTENRAGRLKDGGSAASRQSREQAERVTWRVVKDWLAAQLTLIQTQMATIDQVMLPYLQVDSSGRTLYAAYRESETALELAVGSDS